MKNRMQERTDASLERVLLLSTSDLETAVALLRQVPDVRPMILEGYAWLKRALVAQHADGRRSDRVEAYVHVGCHMIGAATAGYAPKAAIIRNRLAAIGE